MMAWLVSNWQSIVVALVGIDAILIPIFPNAGLLVTLKGYLEDVEKL